MVGLGLSTQRGSTTNNKEDPIPDIPFVLYNKLSAERDALFDKIHNKLLEDHNKLWKMYSDTLTSNARAQSRLEVRFTLSSINSYTN
jgi:hypothetical protein